MAPCRGLWASGSLLRFLPKVLQEPAVETRGCACVLALGLLLRGSLCVLGAGFRAFPATPLTGWFLRTGSLKAWPPLP